MITLSPGIMQQPTEGRHAHAFLIEHGGELSLVDTLFEDEARLVLDAGALAGHLAF